MANPNPFSTQLDKLNSSVLSQFADDAVYSPAALGSSSFALRVVALDPLRLEDTVPGNFTIRWAKLSDFGSTPPVKGDLIAIDNGSGGSSNYVVQQIQEDAGGGVRLILSAA